MKSKKCNYKGCTNPVWSGGLCKNHVPRKNMPTMHIATREGLKNFNKALKAQVMHEFFISIWNERVHKSEISEISLGNEALSIYFHHILPKNKYEQAALDPENIILMTADEHDSVENDMYKYDKINEKREQLLKKYNLI